MLKLMMLRVPYLLGQVRSAVHYACPFGAIASVFAWEHVGDVLLGIARKFLHLAIHRYVDDFFGPERCSR